MTISPRLTFLFDVDNTLLDNDGAKVGIDKRLRQLIGDQETDRFWRCYEAVRTETGVVNYPLTLVRFWQDGPDAGDAAARRRLRFALADLLMTFPYREFVYPGALPAIAHVATLGRAAILSDGDPTYQPGKIIRSGLAAAVDGFVLVYPHKDEHLAEVTAAFPADHYVLIEDKPSVIADVRARMHQPLTTILVHQGKYAREVGPGAWSGADMTIERIGQLQGISAQEFIERGGLAGKGG